jgi:hypothetical protein
MQASEYIFIATNTILRNQTIEAAEPEYLHCSKPLPVSGYHMRLILLALVSFISCNDQRVPVDEKGYGQQLLPIDTISEKHYIDTSQTPGTHL